ncbi:MAG TPA: flagellar basal-body rod protein FlgF [Gemmataceae bacterium]|nr:flagellar basal-body rod protein FlgF [Gemmataceae bacterium]
MLQGYYSAASGMSAAMQNQDILAQNLANAPVPGYRRQALTFAEFVAPQTVASAPTTTQPMHGAQIARHSSSFAAGPYQRTGNPLECAIQGDGFFVLDGPTGNLYTRNGQFHINAAGQLVSASGYAVNGSNGPLQMPTNAAQIQIAQDGTVLADNAPVGQIRLASFADSNQLERVGSTLFTAPAGVSPQTSTAMLRQGYREGSNVAVVDEMVQMLAGMRQYEAASKALRSLSDASQQRINGQM